MLKQNGGLNPDEDAPKRPAYFIAENRLSNEFAGMIGWAPATTLAGAAGGAAAGCSETEGFSGGRDAGLVSAVLASACLVSAGLNAFGSGLVSAFGLAGAA